MLKQGKGRLHAGNDRLSDDDDTDEDALSGTVPKQGQGLLNAGNDRLSDDDDDNSVKDPDYEPDHSSDNDSDSLFEENQDDLHPDSLGELSCSDIGLEKCPTIDPRREIVSDSEESCGSIESEKYPMLSGKTDKDISFQGVPKNSNGNLKNKLHACFFCEKMIANIARHLELAHKTEVEVAKILVFSKKSKERRKMWEELVNKGDFAHNISVLEKGAGIMIPKKRSTKCEIKDLIPCENCKAFYKKTDMWKHSKYCLSEKKSQNPVQKGRLLLPIRKCQDGLFKKVLLTMRDDEVKVIIQSDPRILDYGRRLFEKHGHEPHKTQYISQKLREVGRLLFACKLSKDIQCLDEALLSKNWDILIQNVRTIAGFDEESHTYTSPSLALKIGHSLQKCARYMRSDGIKENDRAKIEEADRFLTLYETEWTNDISGHALTSLSEKKYNKPLLLPVVKDVVKLNNYLAKEVETVCEKIVVQFDMSLYAKMAQLCLAQLILFNRRRSGEAERIKLQEFSDAENGSGKPDEVVLSTLNEFEKKLCNTHTRVEIKGKRGRKVAVLLTDEMKKNIKILIQQREKAKVSGDCLFSKPGDSKFPYRGSDCLRRFAKEAGVDNPTAITSTKLRKQLATLAQILNLNETSQDILATFQGHDIRVHRQFYRLPEDTMQIAKVSKILHSLNNGSISKFKGKDFDEIQLDDKEAVDSESDEEETEDLDDDEEYIEAVDIVSPMSAEQEPGSQGPVKKKPKSAPTPRHHWTPTEKGALKKLFRRNIIQGKTPCQLECLNAMKKESCLAKFPWKQIKFAVKNLITTQKRENKKLVDKM
ncbi:uncharacterized protein [Magallana gigas]|uniref:uncharacterized protein n=1 Tax=Magallana gigas TaxID=29159 RepID=UPI003342B2DD